MVADSVNLGHATSASTASTSAAATSTSNADSSSSTGPTPLIACVIVGALLLGLAFLFLLARRLYGRQPTAAQTDPEAQGSTIRPRRASEKPRHVGLTEEVLDTFHAYSWTSSSADAPSMYDKKCDSEKIDVELCAVPVQQSLLMSPVVRSASLASDRSSTACNSSTCHATKATEMPCLVPTLTRDSLLEVDAAIGTMCAICVLRFREGDQVRQLPCEGGVEHRFHTACIDPWLCARAVCPLW
ncbi:hypothetical protein IE81DRAFT_240437 [Ceraceosorus guamensis]|uniref:RING-type domain-containing protein n=1 Tax=Ceraceosorus guamensis TaxID=1522189 RepID=A0A316W5E2_9BASI|nr:hypothetical protein IE81DRAFT_240437 [Ceraceosorus guamensis]PWN44844.1 hypothetical protein IE81DRAFT_240437 [Ceraceosorus guamensis]